MSKLSFIEPAADGAGQVEVYVTNPDNVIVMFDDKSDRGSPVISYWQLERIVKRIRQEFAFQLDREVGP